LVVAGFSLGNDSYVFAIPVTEI